jgi:hypothetical protein
VPSHCSSRQRQKEQALLKSDVTAGIIEAACQASSKLTLLAEMVTGPTCNCSEMVTGPTCNYCLSYWRCLKRPLNPTATACHVAVNSLVNWGAVMHAHMSSGVIL